MLNIISKLTKKKSFFKFKKDEETNELKKYLRCLKRVKSYLDKCPHCRGMEFEYA